MSVASDLTHGESRTDLVAAVREEFAAATSLVRALSVLREVSPRSLDAVLAAGELASSRIVAAALAESDVPAAWVAFFAFGLVAIASGVFLWLRDQRLDRFAESSAEVGVVFTTVVLITGPLWAKPI